jgi:hypothetical protein
MGKVLYDYIGSIFMTQHPLLDMLALPPSASQAADADSFDRVERAFMDHIKSRIQVMMESYDDATVHQEELYLRRIYPLFFDYSLQWVKEQMEKNRSEKSHADALNLKKEARTVLASLQNDITAFSICYMHIMRFMTLVRDAIKSDEERGIIVSGGKEIKWTSDTGVMLGRNKKRKSELDALSTRYAQANALFSSFGDRLGDFENAVNDLYSRDDAEKILRGVRSALRIGDFTRAGVALKQVQTTAPKFTLDRKASEAAQGVLMLQGRTLIDFMAKNAPVFTGEDGKLLLSASELKILMDAQEIEVRRIRAFVVKYNLPYMEYKLEGLARLRDRLQVIGSLEGLMTLYRKLITGLAQPMKTLEDVRAYEADVLGLIKHLQASQFADIPKIYQTAVETVSEFRAARDEYSEDLNRLLAEQNPDQIAAHLAEA